MSSSPHKYFQGQSVKGQVSASPATCFRDVVERLNICQPLPLTRKAFFALSEKERNLAKHSSYFVPACFQQSPSDRVYDQAVHCNLIFLDLDPEKELRDGKWVETGRCPAAPFVKDPDLLHEALRGLNFAAHLTASSTPEKPRMRVIVDAEEIPLDLYPHAVRHVAKLLGLPSITKESLVPVQCMFLPVQFKDDTEEFHPLLGNETSAQTLRVGDFVTGNPVTGKNGHSTNGSTPSSDGLEFLRAPLPEISLEIAKEALKHIDPDCSYHTWLEIVACLKHQFSHDQEDEAYELFDEWSAEGSKYASADETRAKWDSLRPTPVGREPKTIRSLLRMAQQAGWDDEKVKDRGYNAVLSWIENVENSTKLLEQGIRKILATPQLSSTQEGMLLDQLKLRAKERFQQRISITDLRKDLEKLRAQASQGKEETKKKTPAWANGLCFVSVRKVFYRPLNGEQYDSQAFNMKYGRYLLPTKQELIAEGRPPTDANMAKPTIQPTEYVLNLLQVPTMYDLAYVPSQPNEMLFVHEKRKYVNTYAPTYPEPDHERAAEAGRLFQQHLGNLIKEPEYRRVLIDFMAYMVQFPGLKIRWAIIIQGAEGAGKTYLAEVMKAVLGRRHVKTVDGTTITSGWNEWTFGYQLVVIEEVRVVGTNRFDIMNRMKPWVTNEDIPINEKFRSSRDAQNITNYMLFSNAHDALPINSNDRRYFVVKSPLQQKAQVLALGKDYFATLFNFLNNHPGAMRAWLMNWKISEAFSPHAQAPRTTYATEMASDAASDLSRAVRRLLLEGDHPLIQYDIVSSSVLRDFLTMEEGIAKVTDQQVAHVLREEGFASSNRHMIDGKRHYLWARHGVTDVFETAVARLKADAKNLCRQLYCS